MKRAPSEVESSAPRESFADRVCALPELGLGISTEFGARHSGLDLLELREQHPRFAGFLEIGADLERGIDVDARAWVERGGRTTYHFLDLNLEEGADLDSTWIRDSSELARSVGATWMCGDAGLWHIGPRERGHGTLMPPILHADSARGMANNVRALREASGFEVLPENPPAHVYVGPLHLLDYFARVIDEADSGMLLDVSHLAVYQLVCGHPPLTGLDNFPLERVVEIHVAGGTRFEWQGRTFVEDDHGLNVLEETWRILAHVLPRVKNLKAVAFEGERNPLKEAVAVFERIERVWKESG